MAKGWRASSHNWHRHPAAAWSRHNSHRGPDGRAARGRLPVLRQQRVRNCHQHPHHAQESRYVMSVRLLRRVQGDVTELNWTELTRPMSEPIHLVRLIGFVFPIPCGTLVDDSFSVGTIAGSQQSSCRWSLCPSPPDLLSCFSVSCHVLFGYMMLLCSLANIDALLFALWWVRFSLFMALCEYIRAFRSRFLFAYSVFWHRTTAMLCRNDVHRNKLLNAIIFLSSFDY